MTTPVELVINGRDNTGGAFASAGGGLANIGRIAAGILTSQVFTKLAQGVADFATSIVEEARESELVLAGLDQTLQTMGGVSGMTKDALIELADSIALNSTYTDEAILSASGLMLTFDKIGQETFPRAQQMAVDMAAKFDMDLSSATISLSKALQGTTGSLSALSKQGITFTDEQKEVIQTLFDTGHAAEAQAMIMDAIGPQVDGFAATQVTAWQKVQKQFDNIKETLGTALLPAIDKLGGVMNEVLANPEVQAAIEKLVTLLAENAPKAIDALIDGFENLKKFSEGAGKSIAEFVEPFMPALRSIMDTFEKMRPSIEKTAGVLGGKLIAAGKELYEKVFPFIVATADKFAEWLAKNRPLIEAFAAKLAERFAAFADGVVAFWAVVQPILEGLFALIGGLATLIMQVATGDWTGAWETIKETVVTVAESIGEALMALLDRILELLGTSLVKIKTTWTTKWNELKTIVTNVWSNIKSSISGALENVKSYFSSAWSNIISGVSSFASQLYSSLSNTIYNAVNVVLNAAGSFISVGSRIIDNILTGLRNNVSLLQDYLSNIIYDLTNGLLGSPSGGGGGTGGGGSGGGGCFIAGTMVTMSNGDIKRIEDITIGEHVLSLNPQTGEFIENKVIEILHHTDKPNPFYLVINGHVGVTPNHIMHINGEWNPAENLQVRDTLTGVNLQTVKVFSVIRIDKAVPVYNLHTENEVHNYFAGGVLVHNAKQASGTGGEWITIPPGFPNDKYPMWLTSGEQINVIPAGGQGARGGTINNYYNPHITVYTGKADPNAMRGFV